MTADVILALIQRVAERVAMDRSGAQAMVVAPTELTQPGRMDSNKQLVGRVMKLERNENVFSCYLLCGTSRKELIFVEAWREVAAVAQSALQDGAVVSLLNATLVAQKADKLKWSLSPCRMMVRFDLNLQVSKITGKQETLKLPGTTGMSLTDLPQSLPTTSLAACACLREGMVAICVQVADVMQRSNAELPEKSYCKARIQQVDQKGALYQAELMGWGPEFSEQMSILQSDTVYDIFPVSVMAANAKSGFGLRWGKGTIAKVSNNTTIASRGATASGVSPIQLSVWKESGEKKDYSKATAMQVSASTLAHLIPEKGVQEAIPSDVWELPCITILNIAKNADDAWGYKGCSICSKKVCAHAAAERTCYNMDVEVSDHTATVEMKMWTQTMDPLLRSCGVDTPEGGVSDVEAIEEQIRSKLWSLRCVIVEEAAYQSRNARNRLEVVSIKEQSPNFTGKEKTLFALQSDHSHVRPGVPSVFSSEISVDAAEQVMNPEGQQIEMAELIVQLKGNPHNCANDNEKGIRIIFKCVDLGDPNQVETSVVWVLSMSKMLTVGRLPHDKVLRIIARPRVEDGTIQQWQVIVWTDFAETDIEAWRSRKNWQALKPRDDKAKRVADIALATPKTKYIKVKEELQSPGNIVPTHSVV